MSDEHSAPAVIAEVGGSVDETIVTLSLHGLDLEPDEVSHLLGCTPTRAFRAGDARAPDLPARDKGAWILSETAVTPTPPEELMMQLLQRVTGDESTWASLHKRFQVRFGIAVFVVGWTQGFELSPELVAKLRSAGLGLSVTVYTDDGARD